MVSFHFVVLATSSKIDNSRNVKSIRNPGSNGGSNPSASPARVLVLILVCLVYITRYTDYEGEKVWQDVLIFICLDLLT